MILFYQLEYNWRNQQEFPHFFGGVNQLKKYPKQRVRGVPCDSSGVTGGRSEPLSAYGGLGDPLAHRSEAGAGTERGWPPPDTAA
jgi:hypothetical protein